MKLFNVFAGTALLLSILFLSCRPEDELVASPSLPETAAEPSSLDEPTDPPKDVPKDRDNWKNPFK